MDLAQLQLKPSIPHRCLAGHPWIYAGEIARISGKPTARDTLVVTDDRGRHLGSALHNPVSQIRARIFSFGPHPVVFDEATLQTRLRAAIARRNPETPSCRLVWSEADGLPGLVVDRYGEVVTVQFLTASMEAWRTECLAALMDITGCATLIDRSDAPVRQREGLEPRVEIVRGTYTPPSLHQLGRLKVELDLRSGHKTGAYLDQCANHIAVADLAKGRTVLDVCANTGAFGLHCALAGAKSVTALEISPQAIAEGRRNAALNGLDIRWEETNAFDWLRAAVQRKESYDLIVLDPPSFTKTRDKVEGALRGYREMHVRAFRMLRPGGILATYCCSHHITPALFEEVVRGGAGDAYRQARVISRQFQNADHPVLLGMPESEYLKGLLLEVL
jgi:23S rRNA (cytosine1962-C5)-methyltransferase